MYPCILTLSHHAPQAFVLLEIAGLNDAGKHVRKEQSSGQNHGFNEQVYGWKLDRMFLWWGWSNSIYQRTFLPQIDQSMAISLFWVGFRSKVIGANGEPELFWFIYLGVKGDWPWLRKSMGLFTGPTSRRICHLCSQKAAVLHKAYVSDFCPLKKNILWDQLIFQNQTKLHYTFEEWWHLGRRGCLKSWNENGRENPLPWKARRSVLMDVPGALAPTAIRSDLAHIWPIGVGKEFVGSSILLLAQMKAFDGRSIGAKLETAYLAYREWCSANKQTTKITEFTLRTFKVKTFPVCNSHKFFKVNVNGTFVNNWRYIPVYSEWFWKHVCLQVAAVPQSPRTRPWLHCSPQVAFAPLLANPPWRLGTQMANLYDSFFLRGNNSI